MVARNEPVVSRGPEVMHGELVFAGTRVPAKTLVDFIKAGHTLHDLLDGFPTVRREQAEANLEMPLKAPALSFVVLDTPESGVVVVAKGRASCPIHATWRRALPTRCRENPPIGNFG